MNSSAVAINEVVSQNPDAPDSVQGSQSVGLRALHNAAGVTRTETRIHWLGLLATLTWGLLAGITLRYPNVDTGFGDWAFTREFGIGAGVITAVWGVLAILASAQIRRLRLVSEVFRFSSPWLIALGLFFTLWEVLTAKTGVLEPPFFSPPSSLIEAYMDRYRILGSSIKNSMLLLSEGVLWGALIGFVIGVSIGWSRKINYWVHPLLRFLGPLPAPALLPISFVFFPSSHAASVFLIALSMGFPVAILTWSGVAAVNKAYYDVARTLGASEWFLIFRVAIPAALPQVFVGLFMGLGGSFVVLMVAEMMGVESGIGWYLNWTKGYGAYPEMYAGLILSILIFSTLISLLFAVRDRFLGWQKGTVKW